MRRSAVPMLRRRVGVVFQDFKLLPRKTVAENVSFALLVTGHSGEEAREETERALALVGLSQRREHFPDQLSGGEKQRTAIARALVSRPKIHIEDDARVPDVLALRARIEADPAVSRVDYVTKEQAMARLVDIAARRPDIQIVDTSSNPLQNSLEIKLAHAQDAPRVAAALRQELGHGVVSDVVDNPQVVDKLLTVTRVLSIGGLAVLAMMLIG